MRMNVLSLIRLIMFLVIGLLTAGALLWTNSVGIPQRVTVASRVYIPLVLRNWFDMGPHLPFAYGPYRPGQIPGGSVVPSTADMDQDMQIIKEQTKLIRTYESCDAPAAIPPIANQQGIRIYLGAVLSADSDGNTQQLNCYRSLVGLNPNIVAGIIGNETLLRYPSLGESQIVGYVNQAKGMAGIPVTHAETWDRWCASERPCRRLDNLGASVDFVMAHVHPYWEHVPLEHAAAHVVAAYLALRATYPNKQVIIGETGWPTCGDSLDNAVPGLDNQRQFIEDIWRQSHLYNILVFYFEAFDEDWKVVDEGPAGRCWGMYKTDRGSKHASIDWSLPSTGSTPPTPSVRIDHPRGITSTVTKSNCAIPLIGRAYNYQPGWRVRVEVFTNAWYPQDIWYQDALAPIVDGVWGMPEIVLAGQGQYNNHRVRATLVDGSANPVTSDEVGGIVRINACAP